MHGRPHTVSQAILNGPLHNRRYALPIQTILACRALPTQFPRQDGDGIGQRRRHSRPGFRPRKVLHAHSAPWALHPTGAVAQFQGQLPQRQISPVPLRSHTVDFSASLPANPAPQPSLTEPVDPDDHELARFRHLRHGVSFQSQLFSDKCLQQHLGSLPFVVRANNLERIKDRGAIRNRLSQQPRTSTRP
jgi:hypothetical protein